MIDISKLQIQKQRAIFNALIAEIAEQSKLNLQRGKLEAIYFWGHTPKDEGIIDKSCLSQWYKSKFYVDDIEFSSAEQAMMYAKAYMFNDDDTAKKILACHDPKTVKQLGRRVKNFDEGAWHRWSIKWVVTNSVAKFSQNSELRKWLLSTGDKVLVEASPYDKIWGIGLNVQHPCHNQPLMWPGENRLGWCLMLARDIIREQQTA